MGDALHFERQAASYEGARPPYPPVLYDLLAARGVIGPGVEVLELGAGTGEATAELVARGSVVTAVEPGEQLAARLRRNVPGTRVVVATAEDADLADAGLDSVVAATSMHWVDLDVVLPRLHRALRPGGRLAVWRTAYGLPDADTPFRREVGRIVAARGETRAIGKQRAGTRPTVGRQPAAPRPTMAELAAGGYFVPIGSHAWTWHVDLDADRIRRLFATFSDWTATEVAEAADAARRLGPTVRETYRTSLHLLRRADDPPAEVPAPGTEPGSERGAGRS